MANRKSLNKRFSRNSRGSGGSNVLNPDTDILGDEHPYWWRNLENNTITRPSNNSTNFNQTSRRLNSNSSIRTRNDLDDSWWKVLEGTPRNMKSPQEVKDPSKKDANNGASETSESEEEVKIAKKKPHLQSKAKKVDGNAFLSALNNSRVLVIPLEKDPAFQKSSFAQGFVSTSRISNDSKQPNKVSDTESSSSGSPGIVAKSKPKILQKRLRNRNANAFEGDKLAPTSKRMSLRKSLPTDKRFSIAADSPVIAAAANPRKVQNSLTESDHDLSNCPVPKATSTLLGSSSLSQQNSNSDTEPIVMKPKSKLLRRRDRDTKKNLFENILMEDKINEEKAADQPLPNASAVVDESAEEPEPRIEVDETTEELEPRIVEDESKLGNANTSKRLHPTEKTDLQDPANDSSDTSYGFVEPAKPKSRFLRNTRRSPKQNLFQRIVDDSDSSTTKGTLNLSQNGNSMQTMRRLSVVSADSNACSEDMHLRLSTSSKASDIEIIKIGNNKPSSSRYSNVEIRSSQSENSISNREKTSRERLVLSSVDKKGRNASFAPDYDEQMSDNHSDVTLIIPASNDFNRSLSQRMSSRSKVSSDIILIQPELSATQQSQKKSTADEEAVANLKKGSVEIKDSAVAENADDAADIVRGLNRSRKRSMSRSGQQTAVEEAAISQQRMKSQELSGPAIFNEDSTDHEGEAASKRNRSLSRLRKTSASRAGSVSEEEQSARTPSRRRSEKVGIPKRESRGTKRSVSHTISESETEDAHSPLRKRSKRTSKTQEQVSTPVKENALLEIEDVSQRPSQRLSRTGKGASQTLVSESEVGASQTPAKRQSKRTSKLQDQVLTPVKENAPVEIDAVPQRPSQRLSRTGKAASQTLVSESEVEASQTPAKRQSKRTSKLQDQVLTPVKENAPVEIEDVPQRPSQRLSRTRKDASQTLASKSEREGSQSPAKRQSKRTSKLQEQVLTPVKENAPVEIEDVPQRPSQRLSRTRKGASQTLISESEVETSQTPAKRQSKRTSKLQDQVLTPVKENAPVEIEDVPQRSSQRLSRTRKGASQTLASESEREGSSQSPVKRQSKRTSKLQDQVLTPVKENAPVEIEDVPQRSSQRLSRTRKGASQTLASESEREGSSQSPVKRQSKRTSKLQEQVLTPVKENAPVEIEDVPPRPSQRLSRTRKGASQTLISESEVEASQTPAKRQSKRTSKLQEQVLTPVKENVPVEIEDVPQRPSQILSRTRKGASQILASESEREGSQSPARRQSKRTNKALDQLASGPMKESEPGGTVQSDRPNRTRREMSLMAASESAAENSFVPTPRRENRAGKGSVSRTVSEAETDAVVSPSRNRSKRVSNMQEQTVPIAAMENERIQAKNTAIKQSLRPSKIQKEPAEAEDTSPRQSHRLSRTREGRPLAIASESDAESSQSPSKNGRGRTSKVQEQVSPIEAEDTGPGPSQRLVEIEKRLSLFPDSDSEEENLHISQQGIERTERQSVSTDTEENEQTEPENTMSGSSRTRRKESNEPAKAEDPRQRRSQRQSKPRRIASLLSTDDSETENDNPPAEKQNDRTSSLGKQTVTAAAIGNEPIEAEDARQRRSKRRSKPHRITTLLSSSDSEAENIEFPTESRNRRTGSLKNRSAAMDKTGNEPIDAENTGRRQSQSESSVREPERLHFYTTFDSDDSSDDDGPAGAKTAARSRSQRPSNTRRAGSLVFANGTEADDDSSPSKSQRERARRTQIRVVSISSNEKQMEWNIEVDPSMSNNSDSINSVVQSFLEKRPWDPDQSKQHSILDKEDDVGKARTENFQKPWSTSLKERSRGSRSRSKLSRVDQPEENEEEDERREDVRLRNVSSIAEELESTSPKRSTTPEPFQTVRNTKKRSLIPPKRSRSKVEESIEAETRSELERRSTARAATEENSATPRKRDKVSIRSITKLHAPIGDVDVDRSSNRSLLRLAIDQNAERVGSPSGEQTRPGPSGKSGSLRPLSMNRVEEELGSDSVGETEMENRPKTVHGRTSNLKAGSGKAKSSAAPQESQKGQRNLKDFFKTNVNAIPASQALSNAETALEIRKKVDEIKKREREEEMEQIRKLAVAAEKLKSRPRPRPRPKQQNSNPKKVDKAYLVNGLVYKRPRLPRPMRWVTDLLYQHLWKKMEPKFKLETRVESEKFICRLSEVARVIAKSKTYQSYENELEALMKEMARLQIIRTRHDFHMFCFDFLPYELREKMVPILLPGNIRTIPFDPSKLYEPLLSP